MGKNFKCQTFHELPLIWIEDIGGIYSCVYAPVDGDVCWDGDLKMGGGLKRNMADERKGS